MRKLLLALLFAAPAWGQTVSPNQLPPLPGAPLGTEAIPCSQGSTTYKCTPNQLSLIPQSINNIMAYGADNTGVKDNSAALLSAIAALNSSNKPGTVYLPCGVYHFNQQVQIALSTYQNSYTITGDGDCTIIDINVDMNPAAQAVFFLPAPSNPPEYDTQIAITNMMFFFHQPPDLILTTTAATAPGGTSIQVASATGILVGMQLCDAGPTNPLNPACQDNTIPVNFTSGQTDNTPGATVLSITGTGPFTINMLNGTVGSSGVGNGDHIHFGSTRSAFVLPNGVTQTPGSPGIKYPFAIFNNGMRGVKVEHISLIGAWDGIEMAGNSQNWDIEWVKCGCMDVGLLVGQDSNFSRLTGWKQWDGYGWKSPPTAARPNGGIAIEQNYYDSTNRCMDIEGQLSGLVATSFQCWNSKLIINSSQTYGVFNGIQMDGTYSTVVVQNTAKIGYTFNGFYHSSGASSQSLGGFNVSGGFVLVNEAIETDCGNFVPVQVSGGYLQWHGGHLQNCTHGAIPFFSQTGGTLDIEDVTFDVLNAGPSPAMVQQTAGILIFKNNTFQNDVLTGVGVQVGLDVLGNYVGCNNNWMGWTFVPPTKGTGPLALGYYCAPQATPQQADGCTILAQTGIPIVNLASGTMANNGAFSAAPAIFPNLNNVTYPVSTYTHFPANAIAASGPGSAANFYYTVWSSATAGTAFNNVWGNGTPTVPASPTAFATTGPGAFTDGVLGTYAAGNVAVPGYAMGASGRIEFTATSNQTNSANSKTLNLKYGGVIIASTVPTTENVSYIAGSATNMGVTGAQNTHAISSQATATSLIETIPQYMAVDSTTTQNATIGTTLVNTSDSQQILSYSIKLCPN